MKKRGKKGQLFGMPLSFIFILIIVGLVLVFGIKAMKDVWDLKDATQLSTFVLNLEDEAELIYNLDIGSGKEFVVGNLPSDLTHVCFLDPSRSISLSSAQLALMDETLFDYLDISTKDNVFIVPTEIYPAPAPDYFVAHLSVSPSQDNPTCIPIRNGILRMIIESYIEGNEVKVSPKAFSS